MLLGLLQKYESDLMNKVENEIINLKTEISNYFNNNSICARRIKEFQLHNKSSLSLKDGKLYVIKNIEIESIKPEFDELLDYDELIKKMEEIGKEFGFNLYFPSYYYHK